MAEYINREAAKETLHEFERVCTAFGINPEQVRGIRYSKYELERVPAADVVEVKHGRWIKRGQDIFCSECGGESKYTWHGSSSFSNYCPNCGAKMDGWEDETK